LESTQRVLDIDHAAASELISPPPGGNAVNQSKDARKRAAAAYKNRKSHRGVFAVRCTVTGHAWVGASPNLDAARNGLWFMLGLGSARDTELLTEWRAHGENAFTFEVLEELDDDLQPMLVNGRLQAMKREWAAHEQARPLLP
jgi:hypothetical protein